MAENWLLNPQKKRGKKMAVRRRRRKKRARSRKGFFMSSPKRRRRRRSRKVYASNPRRRRRSVRRRRSYSSRRSHRNPPSVRGIAGELGWAAAGYMGSKVVGNFVTPMVAGMVGDQPIMRIGLKLGVAYLTAWGLSNFMGSRVFIPAMLGGSISALQDAVSTFIAPTFPMLADYGSLETYYEPRMLPAPGMADYMGDGLSPDHDVVV